jgi:hypothetical protein
VSSLEEKRDSLIVTLPCPTNQQQVTKKAVAANTFLHQSSSIDSAKARGSIGARKQRGLGGATFYQLTHQQPLSWARF